MATPLTTPLMPAQPPANPGQKVTLQPENMRAIRVRETRPVTITDANGSSKDLTIQAGTIGYLMQELPNNISLVQLFNAKKERLDCKVARKYLEFGKTNAEFTIDLPRRSHSSTTNLAAWRASDPAGKAIVHMWDDIHANLAPLNELGLRSHVYQEILDDPTKKRRALSRMIAAFPDDAWAALNTPGLPLKAFQRVRRVTSTTRLKPGQVLIYVRMYVLDGHFAVYGGQTGQEYPLARQNGHEDAIRDTSVRTPHYREARKYPKENRHVIQMMILDDAESALSAMAETTICCLLQTWHKDVVRPSQSAIHETMSSGAIQSIEHRLLMTSLHNIARAALQRANYPLLKGVGCNWSLPLQEGGYERRLWIRYEVNTADKRTMLVYRWQSRTTYYSVRAGLPKQIGVYVDMYAAKEGVGFAVKQTLDGLPGMEIGIPLIISIELMKDGKPHPQPWYRGPIHGAWDNCHELHSFAVKVEWKDERNDQWYTYPLQPTQALSLFTKTQGDSTVTAEWRKATSILQFLHNRRYRDPPVYLESTFRPFIKSVVYNHLAQTVRFEPVKEAIVNPPSHVSSSHNARELGKASKTYWPDIAVGRMPGDGWFERTGPGGRKLGCLLCCIAREFAPQNLTSGCVKREANFHVAADEADRDMILEGSCHLCWEFYRRPCTWVKSHFARDPTRATNRHYIFLPDNYRLVGIGDKYSGPAIAIAAPMSLEMYQQLEPSEEELAAVNDAIENGEED